MNSGSKRTLISWLVAGTFGLAASGIAAAQTDNANPSSAQGASTPANGAPAASTTSPAAPATGAAASSNGAAASSNGSTSTATPANAAATGGASTAADNPARRVFDQLDTNHDGMLSFEEFARATIQRQ